MTEIYYGAVVRYCKPRTLVDGQPTSASFEWRENEKGLSVHFLDFFTDVVLEKEKVDEANKWQFDRKTFRFSKNGLFATLDVEYTKNYLFRLILQKISFQEANLPHCEIYHNHSNDLVISEYLLQCVENTYPVKFF
jgi:hypothetical protein